MNCAEFEALVKYYFIEIISQNKMIIESTGTYTFCSIILSNNTCGIIIAKEYEDIQAKIFNPKDVSTHCYLMDVFNVLYPKKKLEINFQQEDDNQIKRNLRVYAYVISQYLQNVLSGDFDWLPKYKQYQDDSRKILIALGKEFKPSHPIYQKFIQGDESWKNDLVNYQENK